jgi:ketosteroid isomerase-like protein
MQEAKLFKAIALRNTIVELSNEDIVRWFFKLIDSRDLDCLLDIFDYDAVVIEPFSKAVRVGDQRYLYF